MTETGNKHHKNTLLVIAGPTAIGKTKTAIILARHFETEIISADSRQFYKALKIGAAAPSDRTGLTLKRTLKISLFRKYSVNP